MEYAVLPPEVNSGRMYAGAGSAPLLAAAAGWDRLAAALTSAAGSYRSVTVSLTDGPWRGGSAVAMVAAAQPFSAWLDATAAQAAVTAEQARVAAAAYEAAFAATVPPPVIAANRAALSTLVSGNVLGQNTAAIAANQADYEQMWAQDVVAMQTYAAGSAAATPDSGALSAAPQTTNPNGSQAGTAAADPGPLTQWAQQIASDPTLAALGPFIGSVTAWEDLPIGADGFSFWELMFLTPTIAGAETAAKAFGTTVMAGGAGVGLSSSVTTAAPAQALVGASAPTSAASYGSAMSAGLGRATPVGGLSVPPTWATAPETIRLAAKALPAAGVAEVGAAAPGGMLGGIPPVAGMVNSAGGGQPRPAGRSGAGGHPEQAKPAGDAAGRPARSGQAAGDEHTPDERAELDQLRELLADLAKERDALERSADSLLGMAGLRPTAGRR
ncbi:PPE family protein [[Mycobacterium] zoologicum]|uniref:PPE family protein n=1 Tax=[Mycobacterium] zoologicum TaxID=2872311 RepID=UPI002C86A965|nr:PPE family protein [Mycolicibacter sp. MYC101]MEB3062074.1 PPE family protein [Mycolicibacter sp. MYC101]